VSVCGRISWDFGEGPIISWGPARWARRILSADGEGSFFGHLMSPVRPGKEKLRGQAKTDRLDGQWLSLIKTGVLVKEPCQQRLESRRSLVPSKTRRLLPHAGPVPVGCLSPRTLGGTNGFWCSGSWPPAAKMASPKMSYLSKSMIIHAHGLWLVGLVVAGQGASARRLAAWRDALFPQRTSFGLDSLWVWE
jgi:hypothetical protein